MQKVVDNHAAFYFERTIPVVNKFQLFLVLDMMTKFCLRTVCSEDLLERVRFRIRIVRFDLRRSEIRSRIDPVDYVSDS